MVQGDKNDMHFWKPDYKPKTIQKAVQPDGKADSDITVDQF